MFFDGIGKSNREWSDALYLQSAWRHAGAPFARASSNWGKSFRGDNKKSPSADPRHILATHPVSHSFLEDRSQESPIPFCGLHCSTLSKSYQPNSWTWSLVVDEGGLLRHERMPWPTDDLRSGLVEATLSGDVRRAAGAMSSAIRSDLHAWPAGLLVLLAKGFRQS